MKDDDDGVEFSQEELARYGESLLDRYMEILSEPDVFEYEAPCSQHHKAGGWWQPLLLSYVATDVMSNEQ